MNQNDKQKASYLSAPLELLPPNSQFTNIPVSLGIQQEKPENTYNKIEEKIPNPTNQSKNNGHETHNWASYLSGMGDIPSKNMYEDQKQRKISSGIIGTESLMDEEGKKIWTIQWLSEDMKQRWKIAAPKFKNCKRRVEEFNSQFPETWYKAPYKYHVLMQVEGMKKSDHIQAVLGLTYENGLGVQLNSHKEAVSNNHNIFSQSIVHTDRRKGETNFQTTIGPFQFNVCSYKQDGRKFRIGLYLYRKTETKHQLCVVLVSNSFTIRAKKTSKKKKRPVQPSLENENPTKIKKLNPIKVPKRFTNELLDVSDIEKKLQSKYFEADTFRKQTILGFQKQKPDDRIQFIQAFMEQITPAEKELMYRQYFSNHKNRGNSQFINSHQLATANQPQQQQQQQQQLQQKEKDLFASMLDNQMGNAPNPNIYPPNMMNGQAMTILKTLAWTNYLSQLQKANRPFGMPVQQAPIQQQLLSQPTSANVDLVPMAMSDDFSTKEEEEEEDDDLQNLFSDIM